MAAEESESERELEARVPLAWVGADDLPIQFANQFVAQHLDDQFLITIGQVFPPPVLGTPEERAAQVAQLSFIPIRPLGRFSMDEKRVRELVEVLMSNLEMHEESKRQAEDE
jgi:hypothetical protein